MDNYTLVLGSTLALSFFYIIIAKICNRGNKKFPPGPSPWPIIGNFHLLGTKPHRSLVNLAQIYGPIMSLKIGQKTLVVISSSTMAKQVLQKQDLPFSTRFITNALQAHNHCKFSVACLPVKELIAYCAKCSQQGKALDICQVVFKTNFNLMCNTLFSKDLADPFSDSKVELKDMIWGIMEEAGKINLADYFPLLEKFDLQKIRYRTNIHFGKLFKLLGDLINERLEEKQSSHGEKNDVLEVLLNLSAENPKEIDHNHIKSLLLDLFSGGTDSPTTTLEWAMAEIFRQPEIMKKVQVELAEVVGKGKPLEESNIPKLPYLQFIVKETLRLHPPAPFLIPRKVEQDVELCNYIISKGSLVLVNVWAIGRDPTFWKDPLVFKPERFQCLEVDMRGQDFELIPFGAGRRICPGLPLALRLVPIMLGSLLNSFNWKLEANIEPKDLDMEETFSFISSKAHPLRVIPSPFDGS
ncbi:hypothetical protein H5410_052736 [Solanum commersonii]|uniref:Cytochrome P450 n=1 Tax=Solanum commersonii TaxID=4109 RepID=A0A9J5X3X0_SOLCO|nr:hypothetical protein H5410_052736 [Solanum commersonii]